MGVIAALALLRVHVLVIELPGRPLLRLRADAAVRASGWVLVAEPGAADLVLVCGTPQPDAVPVVDALWARVPSPRVRRTVRTAEDLADALDSAVRVLADAALQRRETPPVPTAAPSGPGPLDPDWPAGLVLDRSVDARGPVTAVGVRRLAGEQEDDEVATRDLLLAVADAARLLRLAGWGTLALRLDRVVDLALAGRPPERLRGRLRRVAGAVRRSATLRWALDREVPGLDVRARVLALLAAAIDGDAPPAPAPRRLIGQPAAALPLLVAATEPAAPHG